MLTVILGNLKKSWRTLVLADLLFKVIAYAILVPVVSFTFRSFLFLAGRDILTDTDIADFLIHPLGWFTVIVVGGGLIGISALEIATLMVINVSSFRGQEIRGLTALEFVFHRAVGIFKMTAWMVLRTVLLAAPFVVVGGGLFLCCLTDHDINFYLTEKPPKFIIVAGLIALTLIVMSLLILCKLVNWAIAIPIYLFEGLSFQESLEGSQKRIIGHRLKLAKWVGVWVLFNFILGAIASGAVLFIGRMVIPTETDSVLLLVSLLGFVLSIWGIVHFLTQMFGMISFVAMLSYFYDPLRDNTTFQFPTVEDEAVHPRWSMAVTPPRFIAGITIVLLGTSLIGFVAVRTVHLEDHVEVTAHRGASAKAPENTFASVRQAIADGTDWVEIDVQESKDGIVVVAHDSDLKKVAGNAVKIWEATAEELRSIDIGSYFAPKFADERMPTLAEVLDECRGHVGLNIELKYYGHDQNLEQKVIDLVEEHDMAESIVIMSLKQAGIAKIKKLRPDWTVGLLTAVAVSDITRAKADFLAVSTKLATQSFIEAAHRQKKRVHVWTVNDATTMSIMIGRGADNLITDHPDLAKQVLADRTMLSPLERVLLEFSFLFQRKKNRVIEQ